MTCLSRQVTVQEAALCAASAPVPVACLRWWLRVPQDWKLLTGLLETYRVTAWCGQHELLDERERVHDLTYGEVWRNIQQHGMSVRDLASSVDAAMQSMRLHRYGFRFTPRNSGLTAGPCCRCKEIVSTDIIVPYLWICPKCKEVLSEQRAL